MSADEEKFSHMLYLSDVALDHVRHLEEKEKVYGASWKKRGGVGAFMMLARKFDRMEQVVESHGYDIFAAIEADGETEGTLDQVDDLCRYLMLVKSEAVARRSRRAVANVTEHGIRAAHERAVGDAAPGRSAIPMPLPAPDSSAPHPIPTEHDCDTDGDAGTCSACGC